MSECQTHSQDELTSHEKAHLFKISSDTVHRHKRQASIDLKLSLKQTISGSSEIDSQLHNNKKLSEEDISTSLKSKLSIMTFQDSDDQNTAGDQDNSTQQDNSNEQQDSSQNSTLAE